MSFQSVLEQIRNQALSEREKGSQFEKLIQAWFLSDPKYDCSNVWLWEDFPTKDSLGSKDLGIDLVLRTTDGEYWAVQCKFYAEDTMVSKSDVDSFIANSNRSFTDPIDKTSHSSFSASVWISTTEKWNKNALEVASNQDKPFIRIGSDILESSEVDWDNLLQGKTQQFIKKELLPHQKEALAKAHEHYQTNDRGKLIMACGTGKTFTSLSLIEQETKGKGVVLFLVPSIALLNQSLNAWLGDKSYPIKAICICSDSKASQKSQSDEIGTSAIDLALPATTNAKTIAKRFKKYLEDEDLIVVFSTYQSIDAVAEAQKEIIKEFGSKGIFDWIICDEAHRTTGMKVSGKDESDFTKIHDNNFIQGHKRLYMTATPRLFGDNAKAKATELSIELCSMDDEKLYGKEFYRVGFSYAVEHGLLTDYKVFVLTVNQDTDIPEDIKQQILDPDRKELDFNLASKLIGCINGLSKNIVGDNNVTWNTDPCIMKRGLVFCANIDKKNDTLSSKNTANMLPELSEMYYNSLSDEQKEHTVRIKADHIDGSMDSKTRNRKLSWLKEDITAPNECRLLSNVRCLSEGVDVPALDAVIFLSSRNSQVDVVQSVGRVMRNFRKGQPDEKKYGYIIIPVVISQAVPVEEALQDNEKFGVVWTILNALRSHDDRFNATVNKISLNKAKPNNIIVSTTPQTGGNDIKSLTKSSTIPVAAEPADTIDKVTKHIDEQGWITENIKNVIYARLVEKVGDRYYWEKWAKDVGLIARNFITRITSLVNQEGKHKEKFEEFVNALKATINNTISNEQAIEMLAQHLVTRPVFEALFQDYQFTTNNAVCESMEQMIEVLVQSGFEKDMAKLQDFYISVKNNLGDVDNLKGKQEIIKNLYEKFFKAAFPKTVDQLGIVYTPVDCVDFMLRSVNHILKEEFNSSLSDENVHILDPFTGTGTFITRLLQLDDLIQDKDLERKYLHEIHCNEIVLLAYYVADVNIESVYYDRVNKKGYEKFDNICLTDTFELVNKKENYLYHVFEGNSEAIKNQQKLPIRVIISNPPYSVGQKSANDNAQNVSYPELDKRIADTYVKYSSSNLNKSTYDSYVKAFRWASDRIADCKEGGIVAFISNGAWLDGNAQEGMRKCLHDEFTDIYVLNLRGNQRTSGELSRKEGGKIFGAGSRTPIAITFLVKNPQKQQKAQIHYYDIGDYLTREQKLEKLHTFRSIQSHNIVWQEIIPNEKNDWINQRDDFFDELLPVFPDKKFNNNSKSVFSTNAIGISTNRDSWVYNFSKEKLSKNIQLMLTTYNEERVSYHANNIKKDVNKFFISNPQKISWSDKLKGCLISNEEIAFHNNFETANHRPFCKTNLYYDNKVLERPGIFNKIFPTSQHRNLVISINKGEYFGAMISSYLSDLHYVGDSQCFPLYWYEEKQKSGKQGSLLEDSGQEYIRHDCITDWILKEVRSRFNNATAITKEHIFYYVYGILHSNEYRERFKDHLKKSLPRIPIIDNVEIFMEFSKKGKELAELHLNYEEAPAYPDVVVKGTEQNNFIVDKMRFIKKEDKSTIVYNQFITIENIPAKTYEYVVNGKSAIEWIMERYQITINKDSKIKNDPNDWAIEHNKPRYILDLLLSIITVSVKSVDIINSLPKLEFDTNDFS